MKNFSKFLMYTVLFVMSTVVFSSVTGAHPAIVAGAVFAVSCVKMPKQIAFMSAVPATDVAAIAKWAGMYSKQFLNQVLNELQIMEVWNPMRNVSRHGVLLPKFVAEPGLRPLDTNVEENGRKERTFSGRKIYVYDCMKLFKIIPEELIESFLSDMIAPGAKEIPFAQWVWQKEGEKLGAEINDNFYLSEYHADAAAWDAGTAYAVGDYVKFADDDNYYKAIAITAAGQSPTTHPAKWQEVNSSVCFDGPGTLIAEAITGGLTTTTTGAIDATNALTKVELLYNDIPVSYRNKGGFIDVGPDVYDFYVKHERSVYTNVQKADDGDGTKYIYGSKKKWQLREVTAMGSSQRLIANVEGKNIVVGTNLAKTPGITKTVETLHGYKAVSKFLLGSQIADLEALFVNEQA